MWSMERSTFNDLTCLTRGHFEVVCVRFDFLHVIFLLLLRLRLLLLLLLLLLLRLLRLLRC